MPNSWNSRTPEQEIRRLKDELFLARYHLLGLMPDEIRALLNGYYSCKSRDEGYAWKAKTIEALVEQGSASALPETGWGEQRALCPLCKGGSSSPYTEGFTLPEGLRRHLEGWGKTRQCVIMETAYKLALDHWNEKFSAAEQEERVEQQASQEKRRSTETLYRLAPDSEPKLLDEGLWYGEPPRNPEQLAWAEARLKSLGFQGVLEGNTASWVDERDDLIVYADPRQVGRINFEVWHKPLPKRIKAGAKFRQPNARFHLLDAWKNDLPGKYGERIRKSLPT